MYSCSAENVEGTGVSSGLPLAVAYAPVCSEDLVSVVGAARHETAR